MKNSPIIVLIDMDCFYVQVELRASPEFVGKETAVVQYNSWRGGGIIALSYEARARGVNRSMRGEEAKKLCPNIHLFSVPELRGKADITKYRSAGAEVIKCISNHATRIERASIDEAYIDLTDEIDDLLVTDNPEMSLFWEREKHQKYGCHIVGYDTYEDWLNHIWQLREMDEFCDDIRLALGSFIVQRIRDDIYATLGYRCSAGVAHSKLLAKYACGIHKPNQQTVVPKHMVQDLLFKTPIEKIRNLGGKMGNLVQEQLGISTMGQLATFSLNNLAERFGEKTGSWLFYLARGQDDESVLSRQLAQSIGCSKNFPGAQKLDKVPTVLHWLDQMGQEIAERIEEDSTANSRLPSHMCVSYRQLRPKMSDKSRRSYSGSRVVPLSGFTASAISKAAFVALSAINEYGHHDLPEGDWYPPLLSLGLSAGKFRPRVKPNDISKYLISVPQKSNVTNTIVPTNQSNLLFDSPVPSPNSFLESSSSNFSDLSNPLLKWGPRSEMIPISQRPIINIHSQSFVTNSNKDVINSEVEPLKKIGFFARLRKQEMIKRKLNETNINEIYQGKINNTEMKVDQKECNISKIDENSASNSYFSSCSSNSTTLTQDDYFDCDQCSKKILMWEAPEHFDWHFARSLQKQINQEIIGEQTRLRATPVKNEKNKLKRKINLDNPKSNQLTLDNFFTKLT